MKFNLLVVFSLYSAIILVNCEEGKKEEKQLIIEYVNKVENCQIKSKNGDTLHVHYSGKLEDGKEFDSSYRRGRPHMFTIGTGRVIKGWDLGLLDMCEGEKRKLTIPSHLGYGERGSRSTPPHATLIFDCELVSIVRPQTEL